MLYSEHALELANEVMNRASVLGGISEEPDVLTRRFATEAMELANREAENWMRAAGMETRRDAIGNLLGRYRGQTERYLVLGSHLDTVRDAGKYDGPLGVLVAIACMQRLEQQSKRLSFGIEVAAFADEEGLRYHTAYLGSKAYTGAFERSYLQLTDSDGITMAEAIKSFGGDPDAILHGGSCPDDILGYCEVHIEQGPVLEHKGLPVGIVSAISGQNRFSLRFIGTAGHAGTVPMEMRCDALVAASEFIVAAETLAKEVPGLVATVGQIHARPGASNVIPGEVTISLDVRHIEDTLREAACTEMRRAASEICSRRGIELHWHPVQETPSVPCDPILSAHFARAAEDAKYPAYYLPSGAGHDAVTMSRICPVAMLFVRCRGGVSHNPAESVEVENVAAAIDVLTSFLTGLDEDRGADHD